MVPTAPEAYIAFPRNDMRLCQRCGAVVAASHERQHDEFHRWLEELAARLAQRD